MIQTLTLGPSDRLLVIAPHPDDESAATGGLLQHALATGAATRVIFFTDGDNNPWAQRASELRWRIGSADRARFGAKRREEVRAALAHLGVPETCARFLGYPDQSTTDLLLHGTELALTKLASEIGEWRPTILVGPSLLDLHPDHSALGVLLHLALDTLGGMAPVRHHVRFLVHNPRLRAKHEGAVVLPLEAKQQERKRAAILCHRTQLVLRGSWLPGFAEPEERFYMCEPAVGLADHPVRSAHRDASSLTFTLDSQNHFRSLGARTLCLVSHPPEQPVAAVAVRLPTRGGPASVINLRDQRAVGNAAFSGRAGHGILRLPLTLLPDSDRLFAKIERRYGFFDEAGWKELRPEDPSA
ncbi:MAG: PIG-L deacetylase family protein [Thermoanaerobaculales bacterium]